MKKNLDDLERLNALLKNGALTQDEFEKEKAKILNGSNTFNSNALFGLSENSYCMLLHLSLFLGFVHIALGLIAPIVMWALNKDKYETVDIHGRNVMNWIISISVYIFAIFLLQFPLGFLTHQSFEFAFHFPFSFPFASSPFPIVILMILNIVFILMGAFKANNGIYWKYPLSINFLGNR